MTEADRARAAQETGQTDAVTADAVAVAAAERPRRHDDVLIIRLPAWLHDELDRRVPHGTRSAWIRAVLARALGTPYGPPPPPAVPHDERIAAYLRRPYVRMIVPMPRGGYRGEVLEMPRIDVAGPSPERVYQLLDEAMARWIAEAIAQGRQDEIPDPME